jgi:hypothetical protein
MLCTCRFITKQIIHFLRPGNIPPATTSLPRHVDAIVLPNDASIYAITRKYMDISDARRHFDDEHIFDTIECYDMKIILIATLSYAQLMTISYAHYHWMPGRESTIIGQIAVFTIIKI